MCSLGMDGEVKTSADSLLEAFGAAVSDELLIRVSKPSASENVESLMTALPH